MLAPKHTHTPSFTAYHWGQNPYHNFRHAFDVAQMTYFILKVCEAGELLTMTEVLALVLAALCHDIDHPGVNNNFQIAIGVRSSPLCLVLTKQGRLSCCPPCWLARGVLPCRGSRLVCCWGVAGC